MDSANEPCFWMGGRFATDLAEISNDPSDIDRYAKSFWAVTTTFSGKFIGARFNRVEEREWPFTYRPLQNLSWISSHNQEQYCKLVSDIREEIAAGNVYQVNACRVLTNESGEEISGLVAGFLRSNPAKYVGYLKLPGIEIASASPEKIGRAHV